MMATNTISTHPLPWCAQVKSEVAPSFGVELSPVNMRDVGEIEHAVAAFARSPNGGMILMGSALAVVHRDLIVTLAARSGFGVRCRLVNDAVLAARVELHPVAELPDAGSAVGAYCYCGWIVASIASGRDLIRR